MQSEGLNLGRAPAPASTLPWVALVAAVLLAVMAGPIARGDIWIRDDLGAFHLPLRSFYAESLREGWSFDWMPSVFSGFHLTGEGQAGTYHPWHRWLYGNLPVPLAFDLELILNYPLLLLGMYVWLRPHLESRGAALFGGVVFTFGGFNLLHFVHPNALAIVAHVPWLLVAHRAVAHRTRWQRGVAVWGVALLTASQVLLGYPQYVWFSVVIEAWYCLPLLSRTPAALGWMLGAKAAGLLIGAIQWLPTAVAFAEASRQDAAAAFYLRYSLHPANVIQLLSPYGLQDRFVGPNTHELGCYFGAIPMCLAAWLFIPGNLV